MHLFEGAVVVEEYDHMFLQTCTDTDHLFFFLLLSF